MWGKYSVSKPETWLNNIASSLNKTSGFDTKLGVIAGVLLAGGILLTVIEVFLRRVFNHPIQGYTEVIGLILVFIVFLGVAYTHLQKGHVRVDLITSRLPEKARVIVQGVTSFLSIAVLVILIWQGIQSSLIFIERGLITADLLIPHGPLAFIVPIGLTLLTILMIRDFFHHLIDGIRLKFGSKEWATFTAILVLIVALMASWIFLWGTEPFAAGIVGMLVFLVLLFMGMPVALGLFLVGFMGIAGLRGLDAAFVLAGTVPYRTASDSAWVVLAFFIAMGFFALHSGLSSALYYTFYRWIGHIRGGLSAATIAACAAFASVVGDTLSGDAAMGAIAYPEMRKFKYDARLASGCISAGGTIGTLIPPSLMFIIYALLTGQSVAGLFLAGVFPGLLMASLWMLQVNIQCRINPLMGPPGEKVDWKKRLLALKGGGWLAILVLLVLGGIYGGIFTPGEAGAIGTFGALIIGICLKKFNWQKIKQALYDSTRLISMSFLILCGAILFGNLVSASRIPMTAAEFIAAMEVPRLLVLVSILAIYVVLGCFMPNIPMLIISIPIFFPIILDLGYNPIWFGVIVVLMINLAAITPPYGINLFVLAGVTKLPIETIYRGILPFVLTALIGIGIMVAFPQIATWLPDLLGYKPVVLGY